MSLLSNVYLDNTPQGFLASVNPSLACFVLPGYHLPGIGLVNCCLRYSSDIRKDNAFDPTYLFFSSITALRLQSPNSLRVAGKFKVNQSGDDMDAVALFQLDSTWNPSHTSRYSADDVKSASQLLRVLIQKPALGYKRLTTAIIYFSQITCGFSKSYQLAYLGLFACLESLFIPEGSYKGKTLGRRISSFLRGFSFPFCISSWIEDEYRTCRNKYAHGVLDINPTTKLRNSRAIAFGRLHEITRLCLLGFFSIDSSILQTLDACGKGTLQKKLDRLPEASGKYLANQSPFCS